jgi:hypothetical protein
MSSVIFTRNNPAFEELCIGNEVPFAAAVQVGSSCNTAPSTALLYSAVTGPVEIGPIPMRATASTGGSKPRLYCHNLHNTLCICVGDAIHASEVRIQLLYCVYCVRLRHDIRATYPGVSLSLTEWPQVVLDEVGSALFFWHWTSEHTCIGI